MTEKLRVLVNGARGKMGSEAVHAVMSAADMMLVGQTDYEEDLRSAIKESAAGGGGFYQSRFGYEECPYHTGKWSSRCDWNDRILHREY